MTRDSRSTRPGRARATSRPASGGSATKGRQTSVRTATGGAPRARATRSARSPRSMRRLTVIGVLLVFLAVVITPTLRSYLSQRNEIADLNKQVAAQQADLGDLQKQKKQWDDPKYVEAQAGSRLGFAKPGQTLTIYVTSDPKTAAEAKAQQDKNSTWYGKMWQSVVASGKH
ncbi:FtsB family cell division protein [Flexivirga meconopsidis]|uniref:FtsB family cell division protein n=1 Tax=Flexivirga meconopsidis TaxID=2977121 RepID=UPI00223EA753|nr:septum formation initiator family protein [Flexivirga meconopsidis]